MGHRTKSKINKKKSDVFLNILLGLMIIIFVVSGGYLGLYYYHICRSEKSFDSVRNLISKDKDNIIDENKNQEKTSVTDAFQMVNGKSVLKKFEKIYAENNDFVGWLSISGTKIDYPVVFTPNDEQFYIHKNFYKVKDSAGTLFLGAGSNPEKPSDNIIIYGHNMRAGTMFHSLLDYQKEDFYKEHSKITFDTIYGKGTYKIVAAFPTEINENEDDFKYYDFYNANSEKEFDEFISECKKRTLYNIPVNAEYGDKMITLSTCSYHAKNGRFVVVAKKVK